MFRNRASLHVLILALLMVLPAGAFAEPHAKVIVNVRAVKASNVAGKPFFDERLEDVKGDFSKLRFNTFKLVSSQRQVVPVKKKRKMNLADGQTLVVKPLYVQDRRVGMWIHWKDGAGVKLLDTRMHFDCGKEMLTGADAANGSDGTILAINVSQQK